ncbi:Glycosyl hydrolases family 16 [Variovorax sp. YR634]|uniref:glycoside hydrolase family 16 protein n=1 Tax=Variovorax sp. YR634 TaxID=1884385 RepID=UPI00089639E3|nr:glycoside hydrolase family 16 protein [Variovorax sp. YR634]SDZ26195.1 Glycosyl hydrolases family 16 [Variovorax sp. YR634]
MNMLNTATPVLAGFLLCACGGGGNAAPATNGISPPAGAPVNPPPTVSSGVPPGYALVWADEFAGSGLPDPGKWSYDTEANATGWYNNELQYYAAERLENSKVSNGALVITARKEALTSAPDYGRQAYTSARLITRGKASWTYGFFEVRAKLPCGQGTWPAIWMLGTNNTPWPANGEIDIMEQVGMKPTEITGTVHTASTAGTAGNGGMTQIADACTNFHNYQLTWAADSLSIGVDSVPYFTYRNPGAGKASWPFDGPQYLILNLAIGGDMAEAVNDSIFPVQMEVAHVRVYQKQ